MYEKDVEKDRRMTTKFVWGAHDARIHACTVIHVYVSVCNAHVHIHILKVKLAIRSSKDV
jgi:hypothetical protein